MTMPNGLQVVLEEDHSSPLTTVRIFVEVGSLNEGENTGRGLSHYCEHIISGGSTEFRTEEEYSRKKRLFGILTNAYTSRERTVYHQTGPSQYTDSMIVMLLEQVFSCRFDSFEISREHGVVSHEILAKDTPERRAWLEAWEFAVGNHPYLVPTLGFKDAMNSVTRDIAYQFYCQH